MICALLALLLQLFSAPGACAAESEPDLSVPCDLIIVMQTSSGRTIPGGAAALYLVATWEQAGDGLSWNYTDPYAGCGIPLLGLENNENAGALARYTAANAIAGTEAALGDDGTAQFSGLQAGLYLIVQTEAAPGYRKISPFLLTLPLYSEAEGLYSYRVTATPKSEPRPGVVPVRPDTPPPPDTPVVPPPPDTPPVTPDTPEPENPLTPSQPSAETPDMEEETPVPDGPKLPQTGQLWWPVPVLALTGLGSILLALILQKRQGSDE